MLDRVRRFVNPILRRLVSLEICKICTADGDTIGIGLRLWMDKDK